MTITVPVDIKEQVDSLATTFPPHMSFNLSALVSDLLREWLASPRPSPSRPLVPDAETLPPKLVFVFNGQPCDVARADEVGKPRQLSEMMDDAARRSGNERYYFGQEHIWDARDVDGCLLDLAEPVTSLHARGHGDIYVNMKPGIGA